MTIREDFKSEKDLLDKLIVYSENPRGLLHFEKWWDDCKTEEDFNKVSNLTKDKRGIFKNFYISGKHFAKNLKECLLVWNRVTKFPLFNDYINYIEKEWLTSYSNLEQNLKTIKKQNEKLPTKINAINNMIHLYEQQLSILKSLFQWVNQARRSDLYKKETIKEFSESSIFKQREGTTYIPNYSIIQNGEHYFDFQFIKLDDTTFHYSKGLNLLWMIFKGLAQKKNEQYILPLLVCDAATHSEVFDDELFDFLTNSSIIDQVYDFPSAFIFIKMISNHSVKNLQYSNGKYIKNFNTEWINCFEFNADKKKIKEYFKNNFHEYPQSIDSFNSKINKLYEDLINDSEPNKFFSVRLNHDKFKKIFPLHLDYLWGILYLEQQEKIEIQYWIQDRMIIKYYNQSSKITSIDTSTEQEITNQKETETHFYKEYFEEEYIKKCENLGNTVYYNSADQVLINKKERKCLLLKIFNENDINAQINVIQIDKFINKLIAASKNIYCRTLQYKENQKNNGVIKGVFLNQCKTKASAIKGGVIKLLKKIKAPNDLIRTISKEGYLLEYITQEKIIKK